MLKRVATAVLSIPVVLLLLYLGGVYTKFLVLVLIAIGLAEFGALAPKPVFWDVLVFFGFSFPLLMFMQVGADVLMFWGLGFTLYYLVRAAFAKTPAVIRCSYHVVGVLYISCLYSFIWLVRHDFGFFWLMFAIIVTWLSDTGAYLVGTRFGRRKLAPVISPNKSVEGALGALGAAAAVGAIYAGFGLVPVNIWVGALLGMGISFVGQVGDLAESALKREQQIKDSGTLLPGHGGILDRFDSLAFAVPALYVILLVFFR